MSMARRHNHLMILCGLAAAISFNVKLYASAIFLGQPGSYAASDGQLAGGQTLTEWTIEAWIKPQNTGLYQGLFNNIPVEPWKEISISFDQAQGVAGLMTAWPNGYYSVSSPSASIVGDQWQLVSFVGNSTTMRMYLNGLEVGNNLYPGQISFASVHSPNALGAFSFGFCDFLTLSDQAFYSGSLADFRVYDRALPASELLSHLTQQPSLNTPGLRNWIPFNETTGDIFYDIIGGQYGKYYNVNLSSDSPFSSVPETSTYLTGVWALSVIGMFMCKNRLNYPLCKKQ